MRINVFGVGRSGTKAVQLYLALALLQRHERIGLNYEPFLWQNHLIRHFSVQGIREHERLPLFMTADESSVTESPFVRQLAFYEHGVTKFIGGNGRIAMIKRLMRPDATTFVIRDIYEVLQSVMQRAWDFLGRGLPRRHDWARLVTETQTKFPSIEIPSSPSRQDCNAFFWYVSNKIAINQLQALALEGHQVRVMRFGKDMNASALIDGFGLPEPRLPLSRLHGGLIHTDSFYSPETEGSVLDELSGSLNDLLLRTGLRVGAKTPAHGLWIRGNEHPGAISHSGARRQAGARPPIARSSAYDRWSDDVYADLSELESTSRGGRPAQGTPARSGPQRSLPRA